MQLSFARRNPLKTFGPANRAKVMKFDEATFARKSGTFERGNAARRRREKTREGEPRGFRFHKTTLRE